MAQAVRGGGDTRLTARADTIYALSSGSPPAAIAVVRISGPDAEAAGTALAGTLPPPRQAALRRLRMPGTREPIDDALVLRFAATASATGEPLVELHLHGGRAVVAAALTALGACAGCRAAEPGEFTRRAFANGRIDLIEAEGLADLLSADTDAQRRNALAMAEGHLSKAVAQWTERLIGLSAQVEAAIDFSDEDDVGEGELTQVAAGAAVLIAELHACLAEPEVERLTEGVTVVLAGPPNAGKSSLFNALVGADAAIVTPAPGTTRDRIERTVTRAGRVFNLVDTAGLREESDDPIERIGIARSRAAADAADLVLWLGDDPPHPTDPGPPTLWVQSRCDLTARSQPIAGGVHMVSAITGQGVGALWGALATATAGAMPVSEAAFNRRQRHHLREAANVLASANWRDAVLAAEALRLARAAFDRLTGRVSTEDMLDALFGRFCIGK